MPGFVTESRPVSQLDLSCDLKVSNYGSPYWLHRDLGFVQGTQRTTSWRSRGEVSEADEIEQWSHVTRNGFTTTDPVYDRGHEFYTTRTSIKLSHPSWEGWIPMPSGNAYMGFRGPLVVKTVFDYQGLFEFPAERKLSQNEIRTFGARAISQSAPTTPSANLLTAFGELVRDGIPHLPGNAKGGFHGGNPSLNAKERSDIGPAASEEFLNIGFGWVPLIQDVKATVLSLKSATKQARQLVRDSGKIVRRTWRFAPEIETIHFTENRTPDGGCIFNEVPRTLVRNRSGLESTSPWEVQRSTVRKRTIYFKGAFTYYMPDDKSTWSRIDGYEQLANKLLGTRVSPEVAWNLTAWSWLVDWVSDLGSVISNATRLSEDGLVLRYGYLMSHTVDEEHHTAMAQEFISGGHGPITTILRRESKERVKALPFGFGIPAVDFSAKQWAILYALGMTKGDRRLR